jgi:hypothetical protein
MANRRKNLKHGSRKHRPVVLMVYPKSTFSSDGVAVEKLKSEFSAAGYDLIPVEFNNHSTMAPRFDVLKRES